MATLVVRRDVGWADKLRKYRILLDDEEIGQIPEGGELSVEISEGPHVIQAKIDWCGSPALSFEARDGTSVVVVQSALRGWRILLALIYVIFIRHGYLRIELQ